LAKNFKATLNHPERMTLRRKFQLLSLGIAILLSALLLFLISLGGFPLKTVRTPIATARRVFTMENLFKIHSDPLQRLTIGGRRYERLRGDPPYYLEIVGTENVVFVTDKENYPCPVTIHVFDIRTNQDREFTLNGTPFGYAIGSGKGDSRNSIKQSHSNRTACLSQPSLSLGRH
jgi:hypothetical protein